MTTEKFSNGAVKDFQVGDRVIWDKAGNSIYEVVKISGEGITISLLESHPQKGSIHPKAKRRVSLNEIEPLDIGSNAQHHAKSSRGFGTGDRIEHSISSFFTKRQVYQELEKCSYNLTSVAGSAQGLENPLSGIINTSKEVISNDESNLSELRSGVHVVQSESEILQQGMQISERKSKHRSGGSNCSVRVWNDTSPSRGEIRGQTENNLEAFQTSGVRIQDSTKHERQHGKTSKRGAKRQLEGRNHNEKRVHPGEMPKSSQSERMRGVCSTTHFSDGKVSGEIPGMVRAEQPEQRGSSPHQSQQARQQNREPSVDEGIGTSERTPDFFKEGSQKKGYGGNLPVSTGSRLGNGNSQECSGESNQEGNKSSADLLGICIDSNNSICVRGWEPGLVLPELSLEALNSSDFVRLTSLVGTSSQSGSPISPSSETLKPILGTTTRTHLGEQEKSTSSPHRLPVNPLVFKENAKEQATSETVSAQSLERSQLFSPNSSPLKMSQDSSPVPCTPAIPLGHISAIFSGRYSRAGTMHNGFVSAVDTLERPSLENGCCWLESPNALSSTGKGRPPGQSRLEAQLKKLEVLESREVLNPQFLEKAYNLPLDWTNPQELKAATELLEQDALPSATALIPELQALPSAAFSTLIPSVNNYSPLVLGESNLYAFVFPLELKSDDWERNKKVLGDFNYLAPVFPLELKQRQSLVQEKANSYAFVLPLEPEQNLVLGDNQNNSVIKPKSPTKRKASGWLERYTKTKKVKGGNSVTYPRVEGEREPNNSEHWYWAYRWEEKRDTAKSDNGYVTRAVSLPKNKVEAVQIAIARKWSQEKILSFIQGDEI